MGVGFALLMVVSCAPHRSARTDVSLDDVLVRWETRRVDDVDRWGVFVCAVPPDDVQPPFAATDIRIDLDQATLAERLAPVAEYFERWSHGRHRMEFVAVERVGIGPTEGPDQCVDAALRRAPAEIDGVIVVADAQHDEGAAGGWARAGENCAVPCPAAESGRAVYLGASDFTDYWGDAPPLDLVEHEIGHALGWPHSSIHLADSDGHSYDSPYDVMSDSAAPRRVDDSRRHAPGVLAVNQLASGWLDEADVVEYSFEDLPVGEWQDAIVLRASDASRGTRLVAVALPDGDYVTIELVADRGDGDHLGESGVVVHRVSWDGVPLHRVLVSIDEGRTLIDGEGQGEFDDPYLAVGVERIVGGDDVRADVRVRRIAPSAVARRP